MKSLDPCEDLEQASHRAADLLVEIYRGLESRRVDPGASREQLRRLFDGTLGDQGIGMLRTLDEFARHILPNSMGTPHPLYLGLVNSSPLPAGVLADLLISGLNNNAATFHQSPAFSILEEEVIRRFAELFELPEPRTGMILPGGSFATLQAILLARTHRFPEWARSGPLSLKRRPVLYTADASHFSVTRAAQVAGLGSEGVAAIPSRGRGILDSSDLARRIEADRRAGAEPFVVAATVGTTGTGAIDPIAELAELCAREGLWLHVDACYGGAALLLPELRPRLAGIERADSIAVDPHKWFFVPMTAALLMTRHPELERITFTADAASYLPRDSGVEAFRRGLPTSRRASALSIWMAIRAHGWQTIREAVRRNIELTRLLERLLEQRGFRVLPDGELSIACARWVPEGREPEAVDGLQTRIAAEVVASGRAWFATVRHSGRVWLRFNMVNIHAREAHVRELAELLAQVTRTRALS